MEEKLDSIITMYLFYSMLQLRFRLLNATYDEGTIFGTIDLNSQDLGKQVEEEHVKGNSRVVAIDILLGVHEVSAFLF